MHSRPYSPPAMTRTLVLGALAASLLAATPASAQTQLYPGQGITVNPGAIYGRPGGNYPGVIHLHMPAPKTAKRPVTKKAKPSSAEVGDALLAAQPMEQSEEAPKPKVRKKTEAATPEPAPEENNAVEDGGIPLSLAPEEPHPVHQAKPQKQKQTASVTPPPPATAPSPASTIAAKPEKATRKSGLSRQSQILFPHDATDPGTAAINKLRDVASALNALMTSRGARVQLDAYGGAPGDKSSDARRLSLKRALVVRQILIEDGVPSERIDVRALGGIDDNGSPDRVDVFVNAG